MKFSFPQVRGDARALVCAAVVGAGLGLALTGAYMAGGMAGAADQKARSVRLSMAASGGFTEAALGRQTETMDEAALALARRHDSTFGSFDRDEAAVTRALQKVALRRGVSDQPLLLRANAGAGANGPAQPFHLGGGARSAARDLNCLTQAVYYEARGEGTAGQAAVAQVVLNRVRNPSFPNSICAVVFQGDRNGRCQFSFACDGSMRARREPIAWNRARKAAALALDGLVASEVGRATHFHTTAVSPSWGGQLLRVAQVGNHIFYRFGRGAASNQQPVPSEERVPTALVAALTPEEKPSVVGAVLEAAVKVVAPPAVAAPAPVIPAKPATPVTAAPAKEGPAA